MSALVSVTEPPSLPIEEQRAIIYASLLKSAPEADYFRKKFFDHIVLSGLIGTNEAKPLKARAVEKNLYSGNSLFPVRINIIQETLERLIDQDLVVKARDRGKPVYYLSKEGSNEVGSALLKGKDYLTPVVNRLLENLDADTPIEIASAVIRRFILECFARYGRQLARTVIGDTSPENRPRPGEVEYIFRKASSQYALKEASLHSLKSRCISFIKSTHPDEIALKFQLSQSYYLVEILGVNGNAFDPIAKQTFDNAVFYLDTNILVAFIVSYYDGTALYKEAASLASRLNIKLKITSETLSELATLGESRHKEYAKLLERVPDHIQDLAKDTILDTYLSVQKTSHKLSLQDFFAPFYNPSVILEELQIEAIETNFSRAISNSNNAAVIAEAIQNAAKSTRGYEKGKRILLHDLNHILFIQKERRSNPKTWFLTTDSGLVNASNQLAKEPSQYGRSTCFLLSGLLQSISPFMHSAKESQSIADMFGAILYEQLVPPKGLFEVRELLLISEMHADVMATPREDLALALDYVKRKALENKPYTLADMPKVTVELKSFLAKTKEQKQLALEKENDRLISELKDLDNARSSLEGQYHKTQSILHTKDLQVKQNEKQNEILRSNKKQLQQRLIGMKANFALFLTGIGGVIAFILWFQNDYITSLIVSKTALLNTLTITSLISMVGLMLFVIPSFFWINYARWRREMKITVYSIILVLGFAFSHLLSDESWGLIASLIEVAGLFSLVIFLSRESAPTEQAELVP